MVLPDHFSFSGMEKFLNCPQSWYRRYVLKVADPGGWDAVVGSYVHACLEIVVPFGRRQLDGEAGLDFLRTVARELWFATVDNASGDVVPAGYDKRLVNDVKRLILNEHQGPEAIIYEDPAQAIRVFKNVAWERMARLFNEWRLHYATFGDPFLLDGKYSLETDLGVRLGDVDFSGFADYLGVLANGTVSVTDWKSGKPPWLKAAIAIKRHQLQLYAAAMRAKHDFTVGRAQFVYANHAEVVVKHVDPAEAPLGVAKLNDVWADVKVRAGKGPDAFTPKPGPLCSWCPAATTCPAGAKAVQLRMKDTNRKQGPQARKLLALPEDERVTLLAAT